MPVKSKKNKVIFKGYQPYLAGAGPSLEQTDKNTKALATALAEANIPFKMSRKYAQEMWDGTELNIHIVRPFDKDTAIVGYDRWGFVVDQSEELDIDQESIERTYRAIVKWYNKK